MFLIGVASVKLALDTYLKDLPDDDINVLISNYVDYILRNFPDSWALKT